MAQEIPDSRPRSRVFDTPQALLYFYCPRNRAFEILIRFEQCLRVLGCHPITLICPEGQSLHAYRPEEHDLAVRRFDPGYFESTRTYNRLMLSPHFYAAFLRYRYILIYQLDAWVFSDQLASWCDQGWDYVGAPWIGADWLDSVPKPRFWTRDNSVGNGGFSLRRVSTSLALSIVFRRTGAHWPYNEDGFWAHHVLRYWPLFRIPSTEHPLRFSFEFKPAECFERVRGVLPFGCHAWERHDPNFWTQFIPDPQGPNTHRTASRGAGADTRI